MLSAEEVLERCDFNYGRGYEIDDILRAMRIYRNQGIEQAAKVCCVHMTDGFSICSETAVLALKEEV